MSQMNKLVKTPAVIVLIIMGASFPLLAHAACTLRHTVFTDGKYELHFDQKETSPMYFPFVLTDLRTGHHFSGEMAYGNGYSYPAVSIGCGAPVLEGIPSCDYNGTVYEIKDRSTEFGFGSFEDKHPILFPMLESSFYSARQAKPAAITDLPNDVWTVKGCDAAN